MSEALYVAEEMRAADAWAIEHGGVSGRELMERAGTGLADVVMATVSDGPVVVVCGIGNNGGDGFVAARALRGWGRDVRVVLVGDPERVRGDARADLDRLDGAWEPWPASLTPATVLVDALLGTGVSGEPRGTVGEAVAALMDAVVPVVAADVPSGVDASTGEVAGAAVRATATATFHAPKLGLWVAPGKQHAGAVHVVDIGMPPGAPGARASLLDAGALGAIARRGADSTKFSSGHVLVCGGSRGLTGAPTMASLAAARAGAGYVTACVPEAVRDILACKLTEVMTKPLDARTVLDEADARGGALVLGPGLGREDDALALAREIAMRAPLALVLDADGLNAHAGRLSDLARREAPTILTPHGGELARALEVDPGAVRARRLHHAREAARHAQAVVVLKGDDTLVVAPDGRLAVSRGDAPGLATAGTGDVLSGVMGALLATEGADPFATACAAVELHRRAGRQAARDVGAPEGVIATDVVAALPRCLGA